MVDIAILFSLNRHVHLADNMSTQAMYRSNCDFGNQTKIIRSKHLGNWIDIINSKHPYYCNHTISLHPTFEVIEATNPPNISVDPNSPTIYIV